jgi:hypothetical protein
LVVGEYVSNEGTFGFTQLGNESLGIFGSSGVFGRELEQPVTIKAISKIKVNFFIAINI